MCFSSKVFLPSDSHGFCLQGILGDGVCGLVICTPQGPTSILKSPSYPPFGVKAPWRKAACSWDRGSWTSFRQKALGDGLPVRAGPGLSTKTNPGEMFRTPSVTLTRGVWASSRPPEGQARHCGPGRRQHCPHVEKAPEKASRPFSAGSHLWTHCSPHACSFRGP